MGKKTKPTGPKRTDINISVKFREGVEPVACRFNQNGDMIFLDKNGVEMEPEAIVREMNHDRRKAPKVRTLQNLDGGEGAIGGLHQLTCYDVIFAIDTNTKIIGAQKVSVSGFISFSIEKGVSDYTVSNTEDHVNIYEIHGEPEKPELFAIVKLVQDLQKSPNFSEKTNIAIVTDTELGALGDFNSRKQPIYQEQYLPKGFSLLYASADTGWEVLNKFIRLCDKQASNQMDDLCNGNTPDAPLVPLDGYDSVKIRVGRRNARLTIENPTVSDLGLNTADSIAMYGVKKKT